MYAYGRRPVGRRRFQGLISQGCKSTLLDGRRAIHKLEEKLASICENGLNGAVEGAEVDDSDDDDDEGSYFE